MYVCICAAVTDSQIRQKLCKGASFVDLRKELNVAKQCCKCAQTIHQMVHKYPDEPVTTN